MVQYINEGENPVERFSTDDGEVSSEEEGFMKGFEDEDETIECAECGCAVHEEAVRKVIDGETMTFCSDVCAQDYVDNL